VLSVREIFLAAMRYRAVRLVLIHNHPSGDPRPSEDDLLLTKKVREAGELMEIRLLDHIIIGDRCWFSLFENRESSGVLRESSVSVSCCSWFLSCAYFSLREYSAIVFLR
jgi:hypothetical protein